MALLQTPPMGFNNWARFQCELNETLFVNTAEAMLSKGLLAAGYNRLNLDDCWMEKSRTQDGLLRWNTTLFPQGIPWLSQHVQSKGFHLGIYANAGNLTCGGYPGSEGYEETDAKTFASWGIDYLKVDGCAVFPKHGRTLEQEYIKLYSLWHVALSNTNKPLIFSESIPAYFSGGPDFPKQEHLSSWYRIMKWASENGQLARHSADIAVYGYYKPEKYWESIMTNYAYELRLARYQKPGFYNDPDFLIADWPWLSLEEKKSQFALWSSFSAPLIISADVSRLSQQEINYLTNKDIIAVDQDSLGLQATLVSQDGIWDVLTKTLSNGDRLLTVLNRADTTSSTLVSIERLGLQSGVLYKVKNLWDGTSIQVRDSINITLPRHGTAIYRFHNNRAIIPTGMIFNIASMDFNITASLDCLTSTDTNVKLAKCKGEDSQVWRVFPSGLISPLSAPGNCLTADNGTMSMKRCDENNRSQMWKYYVSGNLRTLSSGECAQIETSQASLKTCGNELDAQVFALPSGVTVIDPSSAKK